MPKGIKKEAKETLDYRLDPEKVLTARYLVSGKPALIFLGKEQLANQEIANLKQEVKFLRSSRLWSILTDTLKSQACDIMFTKSENFDDMRNGKMMIYNLDVQEKILQTLEQFELK